MESEVKNLRAVPRSLSVYLGAAAGLLPDGASEDQRAQHRHAVERMIRGIKKYQSHEFQRVMAPLEKIWTEGGSTVSFSPAPGERSGFVLLIPSMINGSEILDLLPGRSFARWLSARGFDVYLLDWGDPVLDAGLQTLDTGVIERLGRVGQFIAGREGGPVDALGYCMGGTLLLGAAARYPDVFGRLALLSAPWDFHAGDSRMMAQVAAGTPAALQLLEEKSSLPVDWIQNVFARVNPVLAISKFSNFLDLAAGTAEEEMFIAVEDWLNTGQDLSAGVARTCILDWYGRNLPGAGHWVDLGTLGDRSVLVVAADRDILVPPESAVAVAQHLPGADILRPSCGHISLMAGRKAPDMVWNPVCAWLKSPG